LKERRHAYVAVITCAERAGRAARLLLRGCAVPHTRSSWIRGLRLYRTTAGAARPDDGAGGGVQARSRFRSIHHPDRHAEYTLRTPGEAVRERIGRGDHTLAVVREFRRVPLRASALGLALFAARLGREARVVAALAHFAERALSLYQPPYLLLARSIEQPGICTLLTGVQHSALLDFPTATSFSLDDVLAELTPLLASEPEWYAYAPDPASEALTEAVSRYAV
jgi:hypothetical protein